MASVPRKSSYRSAAHWPAWTDEVRYELGPDPADAQWVAENLNTDWHSQEPVPDALLHLLAD